MLSPAISPLFFVSRPSNITRLVVSIYVYTIYGMFWSGLRSQFSKPFLERFEAKLNATSSVIVISRTFRVIASLAGSHPRYVFFRMLLSFCVTMRKMVGPCKKVFEKTSARSSVPIPESLASYYLLFAAFATTQPAGPSLAVHFLKSNNGQSPESNSGNVYEAMAALYSRIRFSHMLSDLHRMVFGESRTGILSSLPARLAL